MPAGTEAAEGGEATQQLHADQAHVRGAPGRPALPRVPRRHPAPLHHRRHCARPRARLLWQCCRPHFSHPGLCHRCNSLLRPVEQTTREKSLHAHIYRLRTLAQRAYPTVPTSVLEWCCSHANNALVWEILIPAAIVSLYPLAIL